MTKKIFDILPPEKKIDQGRDLKKNKKSKTPKIVFSLIILLILLGAALFSGSFAFSSAEVKVWPESEHIEIKEKAIISINSSAFKIFSKGLSLEKEFASSGRTQSETKARGAVTVYNEYSDTARSLVPSRIVSSSGKLFWTLEKITIPGRTKKGGKVIPGEITVEVEAAEAGPEYNIDTATFAFPALAGTPMYTTVYAKSFEKMEGGSIGDALMVTDQDLDQAESILKEELKKEIISSLKEGLEEGFVILEGGDNLRILDKKESKKKGDVSNEFNVEMSASLSAVAVSGEELERISQEFLLKNKKEGMELGRQEKEYSFESIDFSEKTAVLNVFIKSVQYRQLDKEQLKNALLGKSYKEAEIFLKNLPGILRTEIEARPFFSKKVPENVNVFIILD
ncbi:MAG: hypothetical protein A2365_04150 [Candidatus Nealsonbacteria bacterium RIFOXYB1_FULL_40_15]|uniref:Baseplate protein J-like domain-containing protein n=2 Tax=Candidatus Nealsoniibacteriota TaxID=1817911 RepID=A0A1G2EMS3_9BACT|nr:MAG: hypothetical protein A2427_04365 [Candidatus Nealsonbacteria bacterium RIFOXYC1_FULL_40_7]OGZ27798.1 MAG: hypothetical protein A2365_04150 [Candidatus Nealsonbacteria bacterium RIFOXYB1_FULL_40_15]OGZ28638.1 MAG: hypothetical protein A2562_03850 [Candidatus Nealsonbacteria bacterium RIFOXYD1_FULL_39_11]